MDATVNIGRAIARERRRRGLTQEVLAEHLGVSKAAVSKWELAQSLPDVALLPRIAAFFSLSLDELFGYRAQLSEAESAALYAQVYAEAEHDLPAAYAHLRRLAAEHYADANLLVLLASLLTMWAAGATNPFDATAAHLADDAGGAEAEEPHAGMASEGMPTGDELRAEALRLLDHVIEEAESPAIVFYAQQQKATMLFQAGDLEGAIALLEPLVRQQNAAAATMLLASAYRRAGREDDAWHLLQSQRLQASGFILSTLMQEVGMSEDAAYARRAADAGRAVCEALGMEAVNPHYGLTMTLELADALRRAGDMGGALEALEQAVDMAEQPTPRRSDAVRDMPLFDRVSECLDPANVGESWAAHKARQADEMWGLMRQAVAERLADPAWHDAAGHDPRYRDLVRRAERLSGK